VIGVAQAGIAADKAIVAGWKKDNPGKSVGSFGPPSYGAAQVMLTAIHLACLQGHGKIDRKALRSRIVSVS